MDYRTADQLWEEILATEEREIFIARMHREEYLVKGIIAPRMETQLTFTCRRNVARRKLRIGRIMRTEIVICIIISRGCYSPSRCNDNAIAYRFTMELLRSKLRVFTSLLVFSRC